MSVNRIFKKVSPLSWKNKINNNSQINYKYKMYETLKLNVLHLEHPLNHQLNQITLM